MNENIVWHHGDVSADDRARVTGGLGATVWLTGLSGSGKSTIAAEVEAMLLKSGRAAYVLDGDNVRHGLNSDLSFTAEDRHENVRRVGEVASLFADAGLVALVPVISPYRSGRDRARARHEAAGVAFFEVFINTPLEVCIQRDPKGLYAKTRAGLIPGFTGVSDPYEPPLHPDLELNTVELDVTASAEAILALLE